MNLADVLSLPEVEHLAADSMSTMAYEYVTAAAADELTGRWNRESYDEIRLRPRVLRDVAKADTRVRLIGQKFDCTIMLYAYT
jgi:4-hydroxymandelate oxidase